MPNHIHYLCSPYKINGKWIALQRIGHSLKSYTGTECNRVLGRGGQFWQYESHDHYVRHAAEYERILQYILNNPVDAGLVHDWQDWQWTYCADDH
jgi:REP element-mobilizing transposase RayT